MLTEQVPNSTTCDTNILERPFFILSPSLGRGASKRIYWSFFPGLSLTTGVHQVLLITGIHASKQLVNTKPLTRENHEHVSAEAMTNLPERHLKIRQVSFAGLACSPFLWWPSSSFHTAWAASPNTWCKGAASAGYSARPAVSPLACSCISPVWSKQHNECSGLWC